MVSTMPKQLVVYVAFVAWMLGVSGCASRSYEVKAIDEQKRAEAAKREAESRLEAARHAEARAQKELSAAKIEAEKEHAARLFAEAKIKVLEQENADLKKRISKPDATNRTSSGQTVPEKSP